MAYPTRKPEITERDHGILRLLWKWKVLSTSALTAKFFPGKSPLTCYVRLQILSRLGFVRALDLGSRKRTGWSIEERGFRYIRATLGELESRGFRSEYLEHDFLTTALHLGEWLIEQPREIKTFSEQQLRRIHPDLWPSWVPRSDIHRPDGYTLDYRGSSPKIYAIETELSLKSTKRYESVAAFYGGQESLTAVIWLVENQRSASKLKDSLEHHKIRNLGAHNFLLRKAFESEGWKAKLSDGSLSGQSLSEVFLYNPTISPQFPHNVNCSAALLDARKRPLNQDLGNARRGRNP